MTIGLPEGASWFIAQLVQEFTVSGQDTILVHVNYILLSAANPEMAYTKAREMGQAQEIEYENSDHEKVVVRFAGLRDLVAVYEPLQDGCELLYESHDGLQKEVGSTIIRPREQFACFREGE